MYRIQGADQKEYGPITAEQVRQWIGENRLNRFTLCAGPEGIWKPLGQFSEFADVLTVVPGVAGASPVTASGTPTATATGGGGSGDARAQALARVKAPALCLLILGCLSAIYSFIMPFQFKSQIAAVMNQPGMDANARAMLANFAAAPMAVWLVVVLFSLALNGAIIFGALRMMKLRSFGWSMTAAILSIVPCGSVCCCLGIVFGVWAALTLNRPDVKGQFQA